MQSITEKMFKHVNLRYKINISNVTPEIQTYVCIDFIVCFGIAQKKKNIFVQWNTSNSRPIILFLLLFKVISYMRVMEFWS